MKELWDLYDKKRTLLGRNHTRGIALPQNAYHIVANVWTVNDRNEFLLTKRHLQKKYGGFYECTGGSALSGESSREAAIRELYEETGLLSSQEKLILVHSGVFGNHFVDTFLLRKKCRLSDLILQKEEVSKAIFVTDKSLLRMFQLHQIAPPLEHRWHIYQKKLLTLVADTQCSE